MPTRTSTSGGATYGRGVYGRTMDVAVAGNDPDTLAAVLSAVPRSPPWIVYVRVPPPPSSPKKKDADVVVVPPPPFKTLRLTAHGGAAALLAEISKGGGGRFAGMVAKELWDVRAFEEELRMNDRILRAYGDAARRFTTLRTLEVDGILHADAHAKANADGRGRRGLELVGLRIPATGAMYTFQARCHVPLDRFEFIRTSEVLRFVRDIQASFRILHAAGFIHADVKRDNMMYCRSPPRASAPSKAFQLIDWGASTSVDRLRRGYLRGSAAWIPPVRPKNCLSPIAWFAYGAAPFSSLIFFGRALTLHGHALTTSHEFRTFAATAYASAEAEVERLVAFASASSSSFSSLDQVEARRLAFKLHWRSFDLFNFGLIVAEVACTTPGGTRDPRVHSQLMDLAGRLTRIEP